MLEKGNKNHLKSERHNSKSNKEINKIEFRIRYGCKLVGILNSCENLVMLQLALVSFLYSSKNDMTFKITIGLVVNHYWILIK
jgi:hypothetical protein